MNRNKETMKSKIEAKPIIIFDGVCNLCNSSVNFIIRHDINYKLLFTPAQSQTSINFKEKYGINLLDLETIVLINNGVLYTKSDAIIEIARHLDGWWSLLSLIKVIPKSLRNSFYTIIARNRYSWFGKRENCMVPSKEVKSRFLL